MSHRAAEWVYGGVLSSLVRWFNLPEDRPALQGGESFQPAHAFMRYLKLWFWILALLIGVALLVLYVVIAVALWQEGLAWLAVLLAPVALALIIVPDIVCYIAIHLRFDTTWYVMTDRSLRIRRGVWVIQETTITFENVQNLKVACGPVQQLFGISSLIVETAGAGGDSSSKKQGMIANKGIIEGVANAAALRDRILPKLRASNRAGLGDDDDSSPGWTAEHVAVLREIRDAVART